MGEVMRAARRDALPADAIFCNGAGNFATWVHRFSPLPRTSARSSRRPRARWATACRRRSAPSALDPERTVVAFAGDG